MEDVLYYDRLNVEDSIMNRTKRVTTSLLLFIISFIVANLVHQAVLAGLCKFFGYETTLTFNRVIALPREANYWSLARVFFIYTTPALICVAFSFFILKIFASLEDEVELSRLFLLWLHFSFISVFIVNLSVAFIGVDAPYSEFYQPFSIVATWLKLPSILLAVVSVVAFALAMFWGTVMANEFLRFSFSSKLIQTKKGKHYILRNLFVYPVILGTPVVGVIAFPGSPFYHLFYIAVLVVMWVGMMLRYERDDSDVLCNKADLANRFSLDYAGIAIALIVLVKVVLVK